MNHGKTVFSLLMSMKPEYEFDKCVARYNGNHRVRNFSTPFEKVPLNEFFSKSPISVPVDDFPNLFINNNI
jgi:hypothetical protein